MLSDSNLGNNTHSRPLTWVANHVPRSTPISSSHELSEFTNHTELRRRVLLHSAWGEGHSDEVETLWEAANATCIEELEIRGLKKPKTAYTDRDEYNERHISDEEHSSIVPGCDIVHESDLDISLKDTEHGSMHGPVCPAKLILDVTQDLSVLPKGEIEIEPEMVMTPLGMNTPSQTSLAVGYAAVGDFKAGARTEREVDSDMEATYRLSGWTMSKRDATS